MFGTAVIALYWIAALVAALAALRNAPANRFGWERGLALLALAGHALWLGQALGGDSGFALDLADSASLVGGVVGAAGVGAVGTARFRGVGASLLALAGALAIGTGSLEHFREIQSPSFGLTSHIVMSALAAGILAVAAVVVLLLALAHSRLRKRESVRWLDLLPPLESLERAAFGLLWAGFAALTLALATGFAFVDDLLAQHLAHKTALSVLAWLIFAVLLFGRMVAGWRGKLATRLAVGGFIVLALAYFGTKFVLEVVLGRHWG